MKSVAEKVVVCGAATLIVVVAAGLILPSWSQSKTVSQAKVRPQTALLRRGIEALERGDLKSAKDNAIAVLNLEPHSLSGRVLLADVYAAQHRNVEAWKAYREAILPNLPGYGDSDLLFRFGAVAEATGHPEDAVVAYRRAIRDDTAFVDEDLLTPVVRGSPRVSDLRLVAKALDATVFRKHGFIQAVRDAVRLAPHQPAGHYLYAWIYSGFAHYRDAKREVDAAAKLLPADQAARFEAYATQRFSFDRMDHGSKGVLGKDGKVRITYFKLPLPNSTLPLIESSKTNAQGP
jgi:Tfp pilus assembly protein PilF